MWFLFYLFVYLSDYYFYLCLKLYPYISCTKVEDLHKNFLICKEVMENDLIYSFILWLNMRHLVVVKPMKTILDIFSNFLLPRGVWLCCQQHCTAEGFASSLYGELIGWCKQMSFPWKLHLSMGLYTPCRCQRGEGAQTGFCFACC